MAKDEKTIGMLSAEWFQIFKKYDPITEDSNDYWDCVFAELSIWAKNNEGISDDKKWFVVRMAEVLMYYEDVKLNGVKDKRDCKLEDYLRKRLKNL